LITAASRGTGEIGEDITAQVKTIKSVPLKINNNSVIEVRGEAIMTKEAFESYNATAEVPLKNLRNGAAGALRNLNVKETAKRNLSAFFYDIPYNVYYYVLTMNREKLYERINKRVDIMMEKGLLDKFYYRKRSSSGFLL